MKSGQFRGYISVIYACNTKEEQHRLWETLVEVGQQMKDPWLLLGDFNVILNASERLHESGNLRDSGDARTIP